MPCEAPGGVASLICRLRMGHFGRDREDSPLRGVYSFRGALHAWCTVPKDIRAGGGSGHIAIGGEA